VESRQSGLEQSKLIKQINEKGELIYFKFLSESIDKTDKQDILK
jgi:hypothetical protein